MLWKYRTILFEFTKDGLLGDHYVDDEEMEKSLNEMGALGWELVNVTLLQDGLLAILKHAAAAPAVTVGRAVRPVAAAGPIVERAVEPLEPEELDEPDGPEEVEDEVAEEAPLLVSPVIRERPRPASPAFRQPVAALEDEDDLPPLRGLERQRQEGRQRREPDFVDAIRIS
jgi:hypothetical protein